MTFLQPLAWLGLLTLPLIVLLHLLRERSRRQAVSSLELWQWLEQERRGPRLRSIPLSWILFLQLLAAFLLTAILAQPQITLPVVPASSERLVLIVDTSTSMAAQDVPPSRLAEAQARAAARVAGLGERDSAVLITAGSQAALVADSGATGLAELTGHLAGLQAAGSSSDWEGAFALAAAALDPEGANQILVLTDGAFEFPEHLAQASLDASVEWQLIGGSQPNQAVVALAARPAGSGAVQVFAQLANFGAESVTREVSLLADGAVVDRTPVSLEAAGLVAQAWTLPPNVSTLEVQLGEADVLPADDRASLGVQGNQPFEALLVAEGSAASAVERALRALPNLHLQVISPAAYVPYQARDLTVFYGWLPETWPAGGVLVLEPPADNALLPVADWQSVGAVRPPLTEEPLLAGVSLEHVNFGRAAAVAAPEWLTPALSDQQGLGLLWRGATASTRAVVLPFSLAEGNLTRRPAFPVLVANAVVEVLPPPLPAEVAPGVPVPLPSAHTFPTVTVRDPLGAMHHFDADRPGLFDQTLAPGLYLVEARSRSGEAWRSGFGVNAGSPGESDLRLATQPTFVGATAGGPLVAGQTVPLNLWPLLVLVVLAVLFAEATLAWR